MTGRGEVQQRTQVGGHVDHLRLGRGVQEVVAQHHHQRDDQEGPGPRPQHAVVEADDRTDPHRTGQMSEPHMPQLLQLPDVGLERGEDPDAEQRGQDQRQDHLLGQRGRHHRPAVAGQECGEGHGQGRAHRGSDPPDIGDRRDGRAEDAAELIGGQRLDGTDSGHHQQHRQLQQPAAPDDGVHPSGGEAGEHQQQDDHPCDLLAGDHFRLAARSATVETAASKATS